MNLLLSIQERQVNLRRTLAQVLVSDKSDDQKVKELKLELLKYRSLPPVEKPKDEASKKFDEFFEIPKELFEGLSEQERKLEWMKHFTARVARISENGEWIEKTAQALRSDYEDDRKIEVVTNLVI